MQNSRKLKFDIDLSKALKISIVLILILSAVLLSFNLVRNPSENNNITQNSLVSFNNGWTDINGEYADIPNFNKISVNEKYVINNVLPSQFDDEYSITFKSYYADVRVYVDDTEIYQFVKSQDQCLLNSAPKNQNVVHIPAGSAGKSISIEFLCPYKQYSVMVADISFNPSNSIDDAIVHQGLLKFVVGMSIIGFGLSMACIAILRKFKIKTHEGTFWFSLFIVLLGLFVVSDNAIFGYILSDPLECSLLSLITFSIFMIPYLLYFSNKQIGIVKTSLQIMLCLHMIYVVVCAFLIMFGVIDIMMFYMMSRVIVLFELFFGLILNFARRKDLVLTLFMFALTITSFIIYNKTNEVSWSAYIGVIGYYIFIVNEMLVESIRKADMIKESQIKEKKAQDYLKVNQINNHFFYHVMFDTRSLILDDPKRAYQALGDFSKYLRYKTDALSISSGLISFHDELKAIKAYCNLQHMMFPNKIHVVYDVDTDDFYVPVLSIQPMVENAIEHGLKPLNDSGTVTISVREHTTCYEIEVKDDGVGFDIKNSGHDGHISVSQQNILDRIRMYGDNHMLVDSHIGEGTVVTFRFRKDLKETYDENNYS